MLPNRVLLTTFIYMMSFLVDVAPGVFGHHYSTVSFLLARYPVGSMKLMVGG